jgi:molybdate transport system substrate-binding protein
MKAMMSVWLLGLLLLGSSAMADEVRLSVAASLRELMGALTEEYAAETDRVRFSSNFGASGTLARQIEQGAPVDLFISANGKWLDYLGEKGLLDKATADLAGNQLVVIGRAPATLTGLDDLLKLERIALVNPKSGPAGEYAEQALAAAGLLEPLQKRLVPVQDVGQAVVLAERGEVDAALVYRTDARLARQTRILYEIPGDLHAPVSYPMALTLAGRENPAAGLFFDFLRGERARQILARYGFLTTVNGP